MNPTSRNRILFCMICFGLSAQLSAEDSIKLAAALDTTNPTKTEYTITIAGQIITPSQDGPQKFDLKSDGQFSFQQQATPNENSGASALKATRRFSMAMTTTTVADDHVTKVGLPSAYRTIHVVGTNEGLVCYSPKYLIPRPQLDLIQMPFDSLAMNAILPSRSVEVGDKWNTPDWLMPMLTGIETAVKQSTSCTLKSLTDDAAVIQFTGNISGAVRGSAANVAYSGELNFDRELGLITSFLGQQKEKRTPGPVSPGLNVTADIQWTTNKATTELPEQADVPDVVPSKQLALVLQTPLRLQIQHSREWYIFHETPNLLMMRQLRDGRLISQCNINAGVTVAPGQHSTDKEFRNDVTESIKEQNGNIISEDTIRDDNQWRIRHVRASSNNSEKSVVWDHYLCSANSGEQFSLVFSHSEAENKLFTGESERILKSLHLAQKRPSLPFR